MVKYQKVSKYYDHDCSYNSISKLPKMFSIFLSLMINHLTKVDALAYRVQIGKTHFFKILKSLVTVLLKITFVCIYLLFIKTPLCKPIENCHIKLCHVYFNDFNMLFKNIQLQILYNSDLDKSLYQWTFSSQ